MSNFVTAKTSAILVCISILVTAGPVYAQNTATTGAVRGRPDIQNTQSQLTSIREKMASKEAALRIKLQAFKDQKKATIAARISTNLNQINQNQTAQMQGHLETMSSILNKLEARVNQKTPDIKDPAAAKAAIASARSAIASASAVVSAQTQKDYTITVTSENRIKADVKTSRDKLHTDILSIRKAVIGAKQAVANAIQVAKSGPATIQMKEGTASGRR